MQKAEERREEEAVIKIITNETDLWKNINKERQKDTNLTVNIQMAEWKVAFYGNITF